MSLDAQGAALQFLKLLTELHHAVNAAGYCKSLYQSILDKTIESSEALRSLLTACSAQAADTIATRDLRKAVSGKIWKIVLALGVACDELYEFIAGDQEGTIMGYVNAHTMKSQVRKQRHRVVTLLDDIQKLQEEVRATTERNNRAVSEAAGEPQTTVVLAPEAENIARQLQQIRALGNTSRRRVQEIAKAEKERSIPVGQCFKMPAGALYCVATSPDGQQFACGGLGGFAALCDSTATLEPRLIVLVGHSIGVESVAWNPDSSIVATGSWDETARLWNTNGDQMHVLGGHEGGVASISWNHRGDKLAAAAGDGSVRLWSCRTGRLQNVLTGHNLRVSAVEWSPDDKILATGGYDHCIRLWNGANGELVRSIEWPNSWINCVAWCPVGEMIAATGSGENTAQVWRSNTGAVVHTLRGHEAHLAAVSWAPDGEQIATGSYDNTGRIWDSRTGRAVHVLRGHSSWVDSVAWSPDGSALVTCSSDNTSKMWSRLSGAFMHVMHGHIGWIKSVAWSPCARHVFTASNDSTVRVYRLKPSVR